MSDSWELKGALKVLLNPGNGAQHSLSKRAIQR